MARPDLAMFSMFYGFNRAYRSHPMPIQLESYKITERVGGRYRPMFAAMMLAIAVGAVCGFWANIDQGYRYGASVKIAPPNVMMIFGSEPWDRMKGWITTPLSVQQQYNTRTAIAVGLCFTLVMNMLRMRLPWFPFHPVGYAVSGSWSLSLLWLPTHDSVGYQNGIAQVRGAARLPAGSPVLLRRYYGGVCSGQFMGANRYRVPYFYICVLALRLGSRS